MSEAPSPSRLQLGRFFPPTLIEVLVAADGSEADSSVLETLDEVATDASGDAVSAFMKNQRRLLESALVRAEGMARQQLRGQISVSETAMIEEMTTELKRLTALKRNNPLVRESELQQLKSDALELHQCIQSARLRLEAVRVVITL